MTGWDPVRITRSLFILTAFLHALQVTGLGTPNFNALLAAAGL